MKCSRRHRLSAIIAMSLLAMLLFSGCAGWRPVRDVEIETPPDRFQQELPKQLTESDSLRWWSAFGDSTLNALIDSAFTGNLDLAQMVARYEQARHQLGIARASWFPAVNASASYQRQDFVEDPESDLNIGDPSGGSGGQGGFSGFDPSQIFVIEEQFNAGLTAAYELDLWGKAHASRQAAVASFKASEEDLRAYVLSLSAIVARSWYQAVTLRRTQDVLDSTIASFENNVHLVDMRYQRGVTSSTDLYQARGTLASTQADAEANAARLAAAEHALSVLLAEYPRTGWAGIEDDLPVEIPAVDPTLPSEMIQRRPDVRAAFNRMVAADRQAAQAVASMFPSFTLTGSLSGRSTDELVDAVDPTNMFWSAIGSVSAPIFQGGRLWNQAQSADANWQAAVAAYRKAILTAFQEVEDALANNRHLARALVYRQHQADDAAANLRVAWDRYLRGVTDYIPVTLAQTNYLNAQRGLLQARMNLIDARISLATALGGSWMDDVLASVELDDDTAKLSKVSDE